MSMATKRRPPSKAIDAAEAGPAASASNGRAAGWWSAIIGRAGVAAARST